MLKKRKYQKWAREEAEQEKVDLKEVEKPMPALKKVERVIIFIFHYLYAHYIPILYVILVHNYTIRLFYTCIEICHTRAPFQM